MSALLFPGPAARIILVLVLSSAHTSESLMLLAGFGLHIFYSSFSPLAFQAYLVSFMFAYPSSLMGPSASSLVIVALDLFARVPVRPRDKIRLDALPLRFRPGRARAQCLTMLYTGI